MKLGCSGIVLKQTAPDLIVKSIRKVNSGEIWLDSHTTAAVMRQFSGGLDPCLSARVPTKIGPGAVFFLKNPGPPPLPFLGSGPWGGGRGGGGVGGGEAAAKLEVRAIESRTCRMGNSLRSSPSLS